MYGDVTVCVRINKGTTYLLTNITKEDDITSQHSDIFWRWVGFKADKQTPRKLEARGDD